MERFARRGRSVGFRRPTTFAILVGVIVLAVLMRGMFVYGAWVRCGGHHQESTKDIPFLPVARTRGLTDGRWLAMHNAFTERAKTGGEGNEVRILLIGDSIFQRFVDSRGWRVVKRRAAEMGGSAESFAIGGDRTQHVLWRLHSGELDFPHLSAPNLAMVLVGTNNLDDNTPSEIASGVLTIARVLFKAGLRRVVVVEQLPRGVDPDGPSRIAQAELAGNITALLPRSLMQHQLGQRQICARYCTGVAKRFLDETGRIDPALIADYVHPTQAGYDVLAEAIYSDLHDDCDREGQYSS
eukprot:Hpha_TRINITY_DN36047_c0_g1::TRINITY_DN36047_c0_g1_i1::g.170842::m.170842/K16795/PAFAH1B2_3; platelet-activating factor acetylhydrolase IB subunit beta/gamma